MKISKDLPQFERRSALLIVTGEQEAEFYMARDGAIVKHSSFRVPKPQYSDREDFSRGGGSSRVFESGAKFEARKKLIHREFDRLFKERLKLIAPQKVDWVYLFCPATVRNEVAGLLPATLKDHLKKTITGNFYKEHPFELLKKLKIGN